MNRRKVVFLAVWLCLIVASLVGIALTGNSGESESIRVLMKDAVLHDRNQINLFGVIRVNPGLISAFAVTGILLITAVLIRILVIPKFMYVPGKFQILLEKAVGFFDGLGTANSPHRHRFLNVYLFGVGTYIFLGTLFELFGFQAATTDGISVSLPAPLSDINAAISLGVLSYLVILSGGLVSNGIKGVGRALKEFSLPISMSFRLFGAMLSGVLVTELVYAYSSLSYVLPVVVGILFTLLHALIQTYVLTMLTSLFYGEVSEKKTNQIRKKEEYHHESV